jgi:hypothetical protein
MTQVHTHSTSALEIACEQLSKDIANGRSIMAKACITGKEADWHKYLEQESAWSLTNDEYNSVYVMSDLELEQSIVEDVLTAWNAKNKGAFGSYPLEQIERFLGCHRQKENMKIRLQKAVVNVVSRNLIKYENGNLCIVAGKEEEAQNFAGVYFFETEDDEYDIVDTHLMAGGTSLLSEAFQDIAHQL